VCYKHECVSDKLTRADAVIPRRQPAVPKVLIGQIDAALAALDDARAELTRVVASGTTLLARREAHASLRHAFDDADALLRQATALARQRSYGDWSKWRHRLSSLDTARQVQLLAEQDDPGVLPIGSIRALDTGMSGPDTGDMQHGQSRAPGALPTYGLDIEALLTATEGVGRTTADQHRDAAGEPAPARQALRDVVEPGTASACRADGGESEAQHEGRQRGAA
jgi:hypothetical protein